MKIKSTGHHRFRSDPVAALVAPEPTHTTGTYGGWALPPNKDTMPSRNQQIVIDFAFGKTYQELAVQHALSHQRAAQIVQKAAFRLKSHPLLLRTPRMQQVLLDSMKPRMYVTRAETPEEFFWEVLEERNPDVSR